MECRIFKCTYRECELDPKKILVMPEGQTVEDTQRHAEMVREPVEKKGWEIAMRYQLIWYGPKRRT